MSRVLFKLWQKVQIKSYLRMKLSIGSQKGGLRSFISMILLISIYKAVQNLVLLKREVK
jgi:hypothetical protein